MRERRIAIGSEPRTLHAVLDEPARPAHAGVVLCHPHPDYGGDMHNAVVVAAARAIAGSGRVALRFDFGGGWIACRAMVADPRGVARVVAIAPPLDLVDRTALASFTVPVRIIVGDRDAYCSLGRVRELAEVSGGFVHADVVHGADHFFTDREDEVAARVLAALD
jgi:uncharacterized protein